MRREFHPLLLEHMRKDSNIHLITADLGFRMFDAIADEFPERFHNVGASEQLMLGAAVGMALSGKTAICYTITPFYWRAAEWLRNYADHERIPVKCVGGGRDRDYAEDGFTHDASDDVTLFSCFPEIRCYWPKTVESLPSIVAEWLAHPGPAYLNLKR